MTAIQTFIPGEPKAQPRPRAFAFNGSARVYDPGTAEGWKSAVALGFKDYQGALITGPLRVEIDLYFSRPKGHFGSGRNADRLKESAPSHHLRKPDGDNCAKAILDALSEKSGIGVWKDDTQVVELLVRKHWATPNRGTGALVSVSGAEGGRP